MIKQYIESNQQRFLDELFDLLRIPSVSADSRHKSDVRKAAEYVVQKLKDAGADKVELSETKGHPIIFGEKIINPSLPTVLVYGHYDVQPADPLNLWDSPAFEPVVKDGKIYARGSCDDKGQFYMHVKAVEGMIKTGNLPCNVKFMIEGEEEVGSPSLGKFCKENIEKIGLRCHSNLRYVYHCQRCAFYHDGTEGSHIFGSGSDRRESGFTFRCLWWCGG